MKTFNPDIDPIEYKDFFEAMNYMADRFPHITAKSTIKLYFEAVSDLPLKAFRDISKHFLMSAKTQPLPNDFLEAATAWKRKNGFYVHDETGTPILCSRCGDLGVLVLKKHDNSDYETLINCPCLHGVCKDLKAPPWKIDLASAFSYSKCPVEWFKPKDVLGFTLENLQVQKFIDDWKQRKLNAEKYWKDLGFEHK